MKRTILISSVAIAALLTTSSVAQRGQVVTPPKARYTMDLGTISGMAGMAGGGMGAAMGMMFGRGSKGDVREMYLRLGSTLTPTGGAAKADHFPSPGTKQGKNLPLTAAERVEGEEAEFQRPKGRLLLFWGCGERAPKGQPVVIDFAKVAAGQMPQGVWTNRFPRDTGPSASNSKTYGEWPRKGGKPAPAGSSVLGEHRVAGNYSPEMKFTLTKDYMPAISAQSINLPSGASTLAWTPVAGATGYIAHAMGMKMDEGAGEPRDVVMWTSSGAREFGGGLWHWLSPEQVSGLVQQKIVMPPTQKGCAIPAEVKAAASTMLMSTLVAFGPDENFVYPPRPANAATPWNQEWTARVRHRSMTALMVKGPDMGAMSGAAQGENKPKCKPSIMGAVLGKGC